MTTPPSNNSFPQHATFDTSASFFTVLDVVSDGMTHRRAHKKRTQSLPTTLKMLERGVAPEMDNSHLVNNDDVEGNPMNVRSVSWARLNSVHDEHANILCSPPEDVGLLVSMSKTNSTVDCGGSFDMRL
eukprot:PhF_6_TR7047/c2_g1_i2/m.10590